MSVEFTVVTIACLLCLIVALLVFVDYTRTIWRYQWERKLLKYLGSFCILFYVISILCSTISHMIYTINSDQVTFIILYEFEKLFWVIAECLTYIIFIRRLTYIFDATQFKISKYIIRILYGSICIFIVLHIQFIAIIGIYYGNILSLSAYIILYEIQIITNDLIDVVISVVLFYLFLSKLYKISKQLTISSAHNNNLSQHTQHNDNNTLLFNSTVKLTVLSLLPVIVTQINLIFETILALVSGNVGSRDNDLWIWSSISVYVYLFDSMCSIFCIYMTYSIENAQLWYNRCCKKCHQKCKLLARQKYEKLALQAQDDNYFELTDDESIMSPSTRDGMSAY